jgi:ferredoxin
MAYQSQDIIRRSATNGFTPAPQARDHQQEVAKLIDVTTCIGCKACQVACSEWNDIRDEVGHNVGVYDNPADLTAKSWTVMRFSEVEQNDKLEWLIRKDGCMHCADPGCLKACPSEGYHSVCQRHRRLPVRAVHRLRLLHRRLPVRRTAPEPGRQPRLQMYAVRRPRHRRPGTGLRENLPDRRYPLWLQRGYENAGRRARG